MTQDKFSWLFLFSHQSLRDSDLVAKLLNNFAYTIRFCLIPELLQDFRLQRKHRLKCA